MPSSIEVTHITNADAKRFLFQHLKPFLSKFSAYAWVEQVAEIPFKACSLSAMEELMVDMQLVLHQFLAMVPVRHIQWPEVSTMIGYVLV